MLLGRYGEAADLNRRVSLEYPASDAAADKISRVSATLDAKAPGKTRTVKSCIG